MKGWKGIAGLLGIAALVMAGVGVACGGGEEKRAEGPEDYARAFCDAFGKHADEFSELIGGMEGIEDIQDVEEIREIFSDVAPLFEDLANDLDKIEPPEEIEQVHEGIVSAFSGGAEAAQELVEILDKPIGEAVEEMGGFAERTEALGEGFGALEDLPPEYQAAFKDEPKCQEIQEMMGEMLP